MRKLNEPQYRDGIRQCPYINQQEAHDLFAQYDERRINLNLFEKVQNGKLQWYALLHRSEEGKSVDLSKSTYATRMVSIHSSQGDGRRLVLTIELSEERLLPFSKKRKNLVYDSLLNVSISRAISAQVIVLERKSDDITRCFRNYYHDPMDWDKKMEFILKIPLVFPIRYPLYNDYGNDEDIQWCQQLFDMDDLSGKPKDTIIEYNDHEIRDATYNFVWMLLIYMDSLHRGKDHQQETVFNKIAQLPIRLMSRGEYWRELSDSYTEDKPLTCIPSYTKDKPLTCIPLLRYKGKEKLCEHLCRDMETIKGNVFGRLHESWTLGSNIEEYTPIQYVMLWYIYCIFTLRTRSPIRMDTLLTIYAAYKDLSPQSDEYRRHYDRIKCAHRSFEEVNTILGAKKGRWNTFHQATLGTKDGDLPENIKCRITLPYVFTDETDVTICSIIPSIDELHLDKLSTDYSIRGLFVNQPWSDSDKNDNKERFDHKQIRFVFVPIEGDNHPVYKEWNDGVRKRIIPVLRSYLEKQFESYHDQIIDFCRKYRGTAKDRYEKQASDNKTVDYVKEVLKKASRQFREGVSDSIILKDLRDSLITELEEFMDDFQYKIL
jgi:hypothetical protein